VLLFTSPSILREMSLESIHTCFMDNLCVTEGSVKVHMILIQGHKRIYIYIYIYINIYIYIYIHIYIYDRMCGSAADFATMQLTLNEYMTNF